MSDATPPGEPSPSSRADRWAAMLAHRNARLLLGLVLPLLIAVQEMIELRAYTIDDAYISFRYARNLVDGHGLVYNLGEPVEGYTNFLWTLLIAAGLKLGAAPESFVNGLGITFGVGTFVFTYWVAERLAPSGPVPCLATWLLASTAIFNGHAVFGLETAMFACLLMAGAARFMAESANEKRRPWSGALFGMAALTRPEAPLFFGLLLLHLSGPAFVPSARVARIGRRVFGGTGSQWRPAMTGLSMCVVALGTTLAQRDLIHDDEASGALAIAVLVAGAGGLLASIPRALISRRTLGRVEYFAIPVAAHAAWRFSYYGHFIPNTLAAKTGDASVQYAGGMHYVDYYMGLEGPVVWLFFAGAGVALARRERTLLAFTATIASYTTYVILVGGDWMLLSRFFAPLQPFIFVVIGVGMRTLLHSNAVARWSLVMMLPFIVNQRVSMLETKRKTVTNETRVWNDFAGGVARWFGERDAKHGERAHGTIGLGDIGRVGWVSNYPVLDVLGLVTPTVASFDGGHRLKTGPEFLDFFFTSAPRYYVTGSGSARCERPSAPALRAIQGDPRFVAQYHEAVTIRAKSARQTRWCVYERRDAPVLEPTRTKQVALGRRAANRKPAARAD
jgi:hypothetical protein